MSDKYIRNVSLKLRLYPTKEQEIYFNKCFGCARYLVMQETKNPMSIEVVQPDN